MLVRQPGVGGEMISQPSRETMVEAGTQLYLGISADSLSSEKAVQFVEEKLDHQSEALGHLDDSDELRASMTAERLIKSHHLHEGDKRNKRQVVQRGAMHS